MFSQQLKKNLARGLVILSLVTGTFSFNIINYETKAEAAVAETKASVNFRSGPSTKYSIIRNLSGGTNIDVISHETSWSKVNVDGTIGYLSNRYINFTSMGYITSRVNLRDRSGMNSKVLIKIPAGQNVQVLAGPSTGWYKVKWNNLTGYIHTNYINVTSSGAKVVETPNPVAPKVELPTTSSGYITSRVNLRNQAGMNSTVLTKIPAEQTVQVISNSNSGWYNINWRNLTGYVYKSYIIVNQSSSKDEEPTPAKPVVGELDGTLQIKEPTDVYMTSANAFNQVSPVGTYEPGVYYEYKTYNDMINISKTEGKPGAWINPNASTTETSKPVAKPAPEKNNPYEGYTEMKWTFTFYTDLPSENGGWTTTAMGTPLRYGVLASNYWPLRSKVILPGWGDFTVEDRGGSSFDSKTRMDMLIPRNSGESNYQYLSRIRSMGVQTINGYIKPYKK